MKSNEYVPIKFGGLHQIPQFVDMINLFQDDLRDMIEKNHEKYMLVLGTLADKDPNSVEIRRELSFALVESLGVVYLKSLAFLSHRDDHTLEILNESFQRALVAFKERKELGGERSYLDVLSTPFQAKAGTAGQ